MGAKNVKPTLPTRAEMLEDIEKSELEALDAFANRYPLEQPGDKTAKFLCERYGFKSSSQASDFMDAWIVEHPDYEKIQAVDRPGSRRWYWVLRRKHPV